jgi:hypothetical protein
MWNVAALFNGAWTQVDCVITENGKPPSLMYVLAEARGIQNADRFLEFLDTENSLTLQQTNTVSAHDGIEVWAERAVRESKEFDWASPGKLEKLEEALAYYSSIPNARPDTLAWHDYTTVIIPAGAGLQQLMIEYTPGHAR